MIASVDAEAAEHAIVDARKPGGVCSAANAVLNPTGDTAGVELANAAKGATTAKPEALVPWAGGEAGREHDTVADEGTTGGACGTEPALHESVAGIIACPTRHTCQWRRKNFKPVSPVAAESPVTHTHTPGHVCTTFYYPESPFRGRVIES